MSAVTFLLLLVQLFTAAVVGRAAGGILSRWLGWRDLGGPERALVAIGGGVTFAVACMVGNIVTGGVVFGVPGVVLVLGAATVYFGRSEARIRLPRSAGDRLAFALAVVVLGLLYVAPVLLAGSGVRTGDPPWHLGWTEQLLGGEAVPDGPAPVYGRNAYPWGWHAVLATVVRLVPFSDPLIAHDALHVILVGAIPLAAACVARRIRKDSGWAAAAAASVIGGLGWISSQGSRAFDPSPRESHLGGDLVVASPNSVYELMPPALPRELGLVLLALAALSLMWTTERPDRRSGLASGIGLGLVGLVSVPMFVSGLAWALAIIVAARRQVAGILLPLLAGIFVAFGLWAGPVVANFVRYGGFVDVTPSLGKEWPLGQAVASWGVLLPLALLGVAVSWRGSDPARRCVLAVVAASAVVLSLSLLRGALGWDLAGNSTLLHQGRTWPPAHLLASALGGVGFVEVWLWLRLRSRVVAGLGVAAVTMVGAASPVLASAAMREILKGRHAGFIYSAPEFQRDGYIRAAARHLGPSDVVTAWDDDVAFHLFEFSGARLADYDHHRLGFNDLRIRYRDLALRWEVAKPFCPTHRLSGPGDLEVVDGC